jgi:hypothetical protein
VQCVRTLGELLSHGLFLNWTAVRRHISALRPCYAAQLGFREIIVEALAGDVMAEASGTVGPAPDVRPQPAGDVPHDLPE